MACSVVAFPGVALLCWASLQGFLTITRSAVVLKGRCVCQCTTFRSLTGKRQPVGWLSGGGTTEGKSVK